MTDSKDDLRQELDRLFREECHRREMFWANYWLNREGRRMVTVPENRTDDVTITGNTFTNTGGRPFPSFPNLASKNVQPVEDVMKQNPLIPPFEFHSIPEMKKTIVRIEPTPWVAIVRDCIARLKAARAKESTNRNLSTLLAVVVKVQKDLETLVGDDWKHQDAAVEAQVTRDDRSL